MNAEVLVSEAGIMKTSKVTKISQVFWPGGHHQDPYAHQSGTVSSSGAQTTTRVSPVGKEPPTNTSMDSGVAGLRDTPVHTPAPIHTTNNNNNMVAHKSGNNNDESEVPMFIVDHSTRTTYMKGRFLGKVRIRLFKKKGSFLLMHGVFSLSYLLS